MGGGGVNEVATKRCDEAVQRSGCGEALEVGHHEGGAATRIWQSTLVESEGAAVDPRRTTNATYC